MQLEDLTKNPYLNYKLPNSFFNIVNFTPVINHIYNLCIDKASELNCDLNFKNSEHRKYIYHYFILNSCEILKLYNKKYKPVIYFDTNNELNKKFLPIFTFFFKNFPVLIIQQCITFNNFKINLKCDGSKEELAISLMRKLFKLQSKRFYFSKLHYFCRKYDLMFLDKTYFNDIRNKVSLL